MALKYLNNGEMISLTHAWVTKDHADRVTLQGIPLVAPLLGTIEDAHQGLLKAQPMRLIDRVTQIQAAQKRIDDRHDDVLRGIHSVLMGMAYLAKEEAAKESWTGLRDLLLPEGLAATQKSYRDEAGQGVMVKSRLGAEGKTMLGKIRLPDGTLLDAVHEWTRLAGELGALEDERDAITVDGPTPADAFAARNQWIRAVNALAGNLDLVDNLDDNGRAIRDRIQILTERRGPSNESAPAEAPTSPPPGPAIDTPTPPLPANAAPVAPIKPATPPAPAVANA